MYSWANLLHYLYIYITIYITIDIYLYIDAIPHYSQCVGLDIFRQTEVETVSALMPKTSSCQ